MKRFLVAGWGLLWAGLATAGNPPVPAGTPVRQTGYAQQHPVYSAPQAGCGTVTGSLAHVLATSLPTTPTVPPPSACAPCPPGYETPCGTPLFPNVGKRCGDRTCLSRLKDWLCFQPGPRVLPILTPTPYHAPIRAYFPCKPDARPAACAPACPPSYPAAPLLGFRLVNAGGGCGRMAGDCPRPLFGNLFGRGSSGCQPAAYPAAAPVANPPAAPACATCGRWGAGGSLMDRLVEFFVPGHSRCTYAGWGHQPDPYYSGAWPMIPPSGHAMHAHDPSAAGATPAFSGPMMAGYRFAAPGAYPMGVGQPAAMGAYPVVAPVHRPFTNP